MTLHNRFMDDIIFVPSNSSTSSSSKKKKKPRNFSGTDLSAKSRHVRSLFRSHLVPVCTRDFTGRVSLIQITTACCYETEGRSVVQKKKKKDRCVHFWNLEKTLLEIYVHREIQIAVKLHLYMNEILISDLFEP